MQSVRCEQRDLIDTLWNVKPAGQNYKIASGERFNRYIVECKGVTDLLGQACPVDLIDTLWNVKEETTPELLDTSEDLIDTLWNVKAFLRLCKRPA